MNSWHEIKDKPCGFLAAPGGRCSWQPAQPPGDRHVEEIPGSQVTVCVCSCLCVFQANSRLKQIEKEYTQKLAKSSQVRTFEEKKQNQNKQKRNLHKNICTLELNLILFSFSG